MERNVFIFWTGKEFKLIKLLRKLIMGFSRIGKGYTVHFINEKNATTYFPDLPTGWAEMLPHHQSDIIRVWALLKYGGVWIDADTIILKNLDCLWTFKNGFLILENNETLCNGVFGLPSGSPLARKLKEQINNVLRDSRNLQWSQIGPTLLQEVYTKHSNLFNSVKILKGLNTVYPVNWDKCSEAYLMKPYSHYKKYIREWQPFLILVNSVYKSAEQVPLEKLERGQQFPLHFFLQKAQENLALALCPPVPRAKMNLLTPSEQEKQNAS